MSSFPNYFDSPEDLYTVHDSLSLPLSKDWKPDDPTVFVEGDVTVFPPRGIITLVDQCSEYGERAVSLSYKSRGNGAFFGCTPTDDTKIALKQKKLTQVTMQLRAEHHEAVKDAIINIQKTLGTRKDSNTDTIFGRLNSLQKVIYSPKAWFEVDKTTGLAPLTVQFKSESQGVDGPVGEVTYEWDFGDGTTEKTSESEVTKTYYIPGVYSVTLKIINMYGEDSITLTSVIKIRPEAPEPATIDFVVQPGQILQEDGSLRTPVQQLVVMEAKVKDLINSYTWDCGDDLPHPNSPIAKAIYGFGNNYDIALRVDTALGSYRITNYDNYVDAVEPQNLWLWNFDGKTSVKAYEFGTNGETFKVRKTSSQSISLNDSFLDKAPNEKKQKQEFRRNNGFASKGGTLFGGAVLFWASGRKINDPVALEKINFIDYDAFADTYSSKQSPIYRPWNWASLVSPDFIYFILGSSGETHPTMSPTNRSKTKVNIDDMSFSERAGDYTYTNGAQELEHNPSDYDTEGNSLTGHFSSYRTAWKDQVGYILRNDNIGEYFALRSFYKTSGTIADPFQSIMKLSNMPGGGKKECCMVSLSGGIFVFGNDNSVFVYKEESGTWEVAPTNPTVFRVLQDDSVSGFDNPSNTMLAASDGDRKAFISFDHSTKAFMKFNESDFTFHAVGKRPAGEQWQMVIF